MDSTIVVAATGIIGVIVGIAGTYFIQKIILDRQRKWALEDDGRKIKRELLSKRLDILEEAVKIMINNISRMIGVELGMPTYSNESTVQKWRERFEEIAEEASAVVLALDSKNVMKDWGAISHAYWKQLETGTLESEEYDKAQKAYIEIVKLTDELRSQV